MSTYRVARACYRHVCEATRGFNGRRVALRRGPSAGAWMVDVLVGAQRSSHVFMPDGPDARVDCVLGHAQALLLAIGVLPR